jgi:hypothetical protein
MKRFNRLSLLLLLLPSFACGPTVHRVRVLDPPRLDLKPWGRVGLVLFTVEGAKGSLHEVVTQRFSEYVLAAQPGVEVLELGAVDSVLQRVGEREPGAATAQALGQAHDVPVVFFGHLKISKVTPRVGLQGLSMPHIDASVSADLSVGLFSTKTGGTLWRSSATSSQEIAGLALVGGVPFFEAKDPNNTYGGLVNGLVDVVTYDIRSTWVWRTQ